MIEASIAAFAAGAIVGAASVKTLLGSGLPPPLPPPVPPPPPPARKPKTRIFYKMKELPLTKDGEDSRTGGRRPLLVCPGNCGDVAILLKPPKITDGDIAKVALKKAPPLLTLEEKKEAFFQPQQAVHIELLQRANQRLHMLHPQE
jgi:hypothetical protein